MPRADNHLWADRLDSEARDPFALQNEITSRIAVALHLELVGAEAARPAVRPDALDYILRARVLYLGRLSTRQNYAEQIALYERALALDPDSEKAQSYLAAQLAARVLEQMTDSAASDIARAEILADRALAAYPSRPLAHYAKGHVLRAQQRFEEATLEYETVLALNCNWVHAIAALGFFRSAGCRGCGRTIRWPTDVALADNASSGFSGSSMISAPRPVSTPPTEVAMRQPWAVVSKWVARPTQHSQLELMLRRFGFLAG